LSGATDEMLAAYDAAAEFGQRIGAIFGNLKPALDMMMTLHTYGGNFMGAMTFLAQIKALLSHMALTFRWLGTDIDDAMQFGGILQTLVGILQDVMNGVEAMTRIELYQSAFNLAQGWMDGLIGGLNSRLDDLEDLMEYIRGLFPSSPAKYGPWRTLPDGETVGAGFASSLAGGVDRGQYAVADALNDLRRSFDGGFGGQRGGFGGSGLVVNQTFNIGNGDPSTVRDAARLGVIEATRMLGVA
jgi:hypothetical protein